MNACTWPGKSAHVLHFHSPFCTFEGVSALSYSFLHSQTRKPEVKRNDLARASEELCQRMARDEEGEEERRASDEEAAAQSAPAHPREAN